MYRLLLTVAFCTKRVFNRSAAMFEEEGGPVGADDRIRALWWEKKKTKKMFGIRQAPSSSGLPRRGLYRTNAVVFRRINSPKPRQFHRQFKCSAFKLRRKAKSRTPTAPAYGLSINSVLLSNFVHTRIRSGFYRLAPLLVDSSIIAPHKRSGRYRVQKERGAEKTRFPAPQPQRSALARGPTRCCR